MIPSALLMHRCSYEPYLGRGRTGDEWGPEVADVPCYIDARRKLVRMNDGQERVSETTIYMNGDSNTDLGAGSLLTIRGQTHRVAAVKPYESPVGSLIEVNLE